MNKIIVTIFFSLSVLVLQAQQNHFVYLQTYNNQPFYLRFNSKLMSSSATGYLIIPKLSDGNYQLVIGFAKNEWPEQIFNISVRANTGFELKNFGDKGWGLYDLQTTQVTMGGNSIPVAPAVAATAKKNDAFADMLSNVVNDSTIRVDETQASKNNVSKTAEAEEKLIVANTASSTVVPTALLYSDVKKTTDNVTANGIERIYIDNTGIAVDTVHVFLEVSNVAAAVLPTEDKKVIDKVIEDTAAKKVIEEKAPLPKFIEDTPAPSDKNNGGKTEVAVSKTTGLSMINSDCHAIATDEDFLRLRKKMAGEKSDEDMIKVAKKAFKSKCYNTAYIKNLGALFLTDKAKYNFFDTAYPFVPDSPSFPALEKELTDDYYITRFRAMIHK